MAVVEGLVPRSGAAGFEAGYARLKVAPRSSGYIGSHLLKRTSDAGMHYRLETMWDSRSSLDRTRTGPRGDWAIGLFLGAGSRPDYEIFEVAGGFLSDPCPRGPVKWD